MSATKRNETAEETGAEHGNAEHSTKQRHRFKTGAAFAFPVHVSEIQPKCEFVERQGATNAIDCGHDAAHPDATAVLPGSRPDDPEKSNQEKVKDPPDEVVDVAAPHRDVVKRAHPVVNGPRERAH